MKIFVISRGWPTDKEPQWGCFERDQAKALCALGHQIVVLSVDVRVMFALRKYGITKQKENNITIYNLYAGPIWGRLLRFFSIRYTRYAKRKLFLYLLRKTITLEGEPVVLYAH